MNAKEKLTELAEWLDENATRLSGKYPEFSTMTAEMFRDTGEMMGPVETTVMSLAYTVRELEREVETLKTPKVVH